MLSTLVCLIKARQQLAQVSGDASGRGLLCHSSWQDHDDDGCGGSFFVMFLFFLMHTTRCSCDAITVLTTYKKEVLRVLVRKELEGANQNFHHSIFQQNNF
jgi:hypothetical protein